MSWTTKQRMTVVAVVLLAASVPLLWQIDSVRAAQAVDQERSDLVQQTVTERHAADDYDGDGISDSADDCPTRPETENGFQDADGCPDVVESTGAS